MKPAVTLASRRAILLGKRRNWHRLPGPQPPHPPEPLSEIGRADKGTLLRAAPRLRRERGWLG